MPSSLRRLAGATVALGTVYLAACSLGLDGLSGGGADAGVQSDDGATPTLTGPDGAAPATDGGDAAAPADAHVDCPGHDDAIFCDSFDAPALQSVWNVTAQNGGNVTIADGGVVATIPVIATENVEGEANLAVTVPFTGTGKLRSYVDLLVNTASNRGAYLDSVSLTDGVHYFDIQVFDRNDGARIETDAHLDDGGFTTSTYELPQFPASWVRAIFEIDYTIPASPAFTFSLANPPDATPTVLVDRTAIDWHYTPNNAIIDLGEADVNEPTTSAWRVFYDNLAVTKP